MLVLFYITTAFAIYSQVLQVACLGLFNQGSKETICFIPDTGHSTGVSSAGQQSVCGSHTFPIDTHLTLQCVTIINLFSFELRVYII